LLKLRVAFTDLWLGTLFFYSSSPLHPLDSLSLCIPIVLFSIMDNKKGRVSPSQYLLYPIFILTRLNLTRLNLNLAHLSLILLALLNRLTRHFLRGILLHRPRKAHLRLIDLPFLPLAVGNIIRL